MWQQHGPSGDEKWINELYDAALKQANNDERAQALAYLERWLNTQRDRSIPALAFTAYDKFAWLPLDLAGATTRLGFFNHN